MAIILDGGNAPPIGSLPGYSPLVRRRDLAGTCWRHEANLTPGPRLRHGGTVGTCIA